MEGVYDNPDAFIVKLKQQQQQQQQQKKKQKKTVNASS